MREIRRLDGNDPKGRLSCDGARPPPSNFMPIPKGICTASAIEAAALPPESIDQEESHGAKTMGEPAGGLDLG